MEVKKVKQHLLQIPGDEYYKQIVQLANVAIVKFDNTFRITDFTGNAEHIFGFTREDVIGKSLYNTIVPQIESTGRDLKKLIKNICSNVAQYEYNINENITKDGQRLWIQWYNSDIKDKHGKKTGILSIGINITDRIQAEIALKESEERFKTLSDLTFEGILIHENGVIVDCNLSFERQVGYSRSELIGMQIYETLIDTKYQKIHTNNKKSGLIRYEAEARIKDGRIIPISVESRRIKIAKRELQVAAVRDISELKKTMNELENYKHQLEELVKQRTDELKQKNEILQLERNQLRALIDHIPELIYIKDSDSRFINANKQLIKHVKRRKLSEIINLNDFDFFDKRYAEKYYNDEKEIISSGKAIINEEELSINELGKQIYLSTTKVPFKDKNGKIIGIVGIGRNITDKIIAETKLKVQAKNLEDSNILLEERSKKIELLNKELLDFNKKLEDANMVLNDRKEELETTLEQLRKTQNHLVQSEKMASLGVLIAGIAHEINNPVNFIYAGVNSALKDFEDIMVVNKAVENLNSQASDITVQIQNIEKLRKSHEFETAYTAISETLQDIKLGANRIKEIVNGMSHFSRLETESWKKSDLHEEIDNVLILLKNKYKHHIQIIKNYDPNLPLADCFRGKLNQVFMNIINNAIDAIEDNAGTITLSTCYSDSYAYISIKDNGHGIKESDKKRIFDPFFTTKEIGNGLGLGLSISYSIIQEHHGEIQVKSKPGSGTEFLIKLPVNQ